MLTIAIDAEHHRQAAAGVARAADGLTTALRARSDVRVLELGRGPVVRRGLQKKLTTARQDLLWYPFLSARRAAQLGADVYHLPFLRGPITKGSIPTVITVHDMVPMRHPETMPVWHRVYTRAVMRRILHCADRVIASSRDSANDVETLLGGGGDKIRIVHVGVDPLFFDHSEVEKVDSPPYVLFVGTPEPRKNLSRLVSAMAILRSRGFRHRLMVVGGGGWGGTTAWGDFVDLVGRVPDERLKVLYANAACVALPSLHEGFGLPALEAMAVGTPVVAAASGGLPEITGGAASMVDPLSVESIANGIAAAISDPESFIALGKSWVSRFAWSQIAALTVDIYREIA